VALAFVFIAHALPTALMSPISGPLADRVDKRKLMAASYACAAGLTFIMWGVSDGSVWLIQIILCIRVCIGTIGMTARSAAIPQLVSPAELHNANALLGLTWSLTFAVGLALGGVVASLIGPSGAIFVDAITFILASLIYLGLPELRPGGTSEKPPKPGIRDMLEAWHFVRSSRRLTVVALSKIPPMVANAGGWLFLNFVAVTRLPALEAGLALGVMHAMRALGSGVGPLLPAHILPRNTLSGPILTFVGIALFAWTETPYIFLMGLFIWGAGSGHNWVVTTATLQTVAPRHLMGRITALDFSILSSTETVIILLAAVLIDQLNSPIMGVVMTLVLGVLFWAVLLQKFLTSAPIEVIDQA
ncbi:MAG: MFS transporter, partial [Myxococcota bacterium]|nr:MFS transporter [Myxococcota bacterium]